MWLFELLVSASVVGVSSGILFAQWEKRQSRKPVVPLEDSE